MTLAILEAQPGPEGKPSFAHTSPDRGSVFSVIGLFLQSIFIRPFNAFLDRLMVLPDDHSEHPPR